MKKVIEETIWFEYRGVTQMIWHRADSREEFQPVTEKLLAQKIPEYNVLIEEERKKRMWKFLNSCKVVLKVECDILNTIKRPTSDPELLKDGTQLLLETPNLFEDSEAGYRLFAMAFTSARYEALGKEMEDLEPALFITTQSSEAIDLIVDWLSAIEPRTKWRKKAKNVLKYIVLLCWTIVIHRLSDGKYKISTIRL